MCVVQAVGAAQVFVLIAGFRYGSLVRDQPDMSYCELEHETAEALGHPTTGFLLGRSFVIFGRVVGVDLPGRC